MPDGGMRPFYTSSEYNKLRKKFSAKIDDIQFCQYNKYLGIIPVEISDIYPAAHYVMADSESQHDEFPEFTKTWKMFLKHNQFKYIYAVQDEFLKHHSKGVKTKIKFFNMKK
jgi:7-cyano-7-deazaguanine tRNA-ribosyltransferase